LVQRKADWYRARAAEFAAAARIAVAFNEAEAQRWLRRAEAAEKQDPDGERQD
jgi:hypothetical protein